MGGFSNYSASGQAISTPAQIEAIQAQFNANVNQQTSVRLIRIFLQIVDELTPLRLYLVYLFIGKFVLCYIAMVGFIELCVNDLLTGVVLISCHWDSYICSHTPSLFTGLICSVN